MKTLFQLEPAMILGAIQALLALAISFGLGLSADQVGSIMAIAAAVIALITRSQVTPTAKLN